MRRAYRGTGVGTDLQVCPAGQRGRQWTDLKVCPYSACSGEFEWVVEGVFR